MQVEVLVLFEHVVVNDFDIDFLKAEITFALLRSLRSLIVKLISKRVSITGVDEPIFRFAPRNVLAEGSFQAQEELFSAIRALFVMLDEETSR